MEIQAKEIIEHFKGIDTKSLSYIDFHKIRYIYLIQKLDAIIQSFNQSEQMRILDIGPAYQTNLLRKYFPNAKIDTLGFNHPANNLKEGETHYKQDLNDTSETWEIEKNKYHVILFCEVVEHLYTKPEFSLKKLKTALIDNGRIIIQTPNAAAIHKRIRLLFGANPYDLLDESKMGHFREYTPKELKQILENVSLTPESVELKNYFNSNTTVFNRLFVKLEPIIPRAFRDGVTIIGINDK